MSAGSSRSARIGVEVGERITDDVGHEIGAGVAVEELRNELRGSDQFGGLRLDQQYVTGVERRRQGTTNCWRSATPEGVEHLGGVDFDAAVLGHVLGALGANAAALDPEDPAVTVGLARLRLDRAEAQEALSTDVDTLVPVALPGLSTTVRVTRAEFELMIRPALAETLAAMGRAVQSARVEASTLRGILLVGGSSRIPLVSELLTREFMVPTALDAHPKHDVALGSVRVGREPADVGPSPAPSNLSARRGVGRRCALSRRRLASTLRIPVTPSPPNPARAVRPSASAPRGVARCTRRPGSPPPVEPLGAAAPANAGGAGAPSAGPDAAPLPGPSGMGPGTSPTGILAQPARGVGTAARRPGPGPRGGAGGRRPGRRSRGDHRPAQR